MELRKLTAAVLSVPMMMTAATNPMTSYLTANADDEEIVYDSYGRAYEDELMSHNTSNSDTKYELFDVNSDGTPELFISAEKYQIDVLYVSTFKDGKHIELAHTQITGTDCTAYAVPSKSYIYFTSNIEGEIGTKVYEFDGTKLNEIASLSDTSAAVSADYKGYKFNNKEITKEQYDSYITQYTSDSTKIDISKTPEYLINYDGIQYINYLDSVTVNSINNESATSLNIPATVKGLPVTDLDAQELGYIGSLKEVTVDPQNTHMISENGVVYSKDKSELLFFPPAKSNDSFTFPEETHTIGFGAFYLNTKITNIVIPEQIHKIEVSAFNLPNLESITILDPQCDIIDQFERISSNEALPPNTISNWYPGLSWYPDENKADGIYKGVIKGYDGSTAQQYAQFYNLKFESLGPSPTAVTTTLPNTTTTPPVTTNSHRTTTAPITIFPSVSKTKAIETSTTTTVTSTTTTESSTKPIEYKFGDVNGDNIIDGRDATDILTEYAAVSAGKGAKFSKAQNSSGDANKDGVIDGRDATTILTYYAYISTGESMSLEDFISNAEKRR